MRDYAVLGLGFNVAAPADGWPEDLRDVAGALYDGCLLYTSACKAAKAHGVKISCDLNYRGKLWTREQAREAMTELCQYVDVCISNEEDAKDVFGIEAEATDIYAGEILSLIHIS